MEEGPDSSYIKYDYIVFVVFQLISSVSTGVQSIIITSLFDFPSCHNMYLNFFTIHEVGKLWTGLALHHIRYRKVSDYLYNV